MLLFQTLTLNTPLFIYLDIFRIEDTKLATKLKLLFRLSS